MAGAPRRTAAALVLAAGVLLAGAACTSGTEHSGGTERSGGSEPPATRDVDPATRGFPTPPPVITRSPAEACGQQPYVAGSFDAKAVRAYTPQGPAYRGPGPHPVRLLRADSADGGPELPHQWAPPGGVQLVVCEYEDTDFANRQVGICEYLGGDALGGTSRVESARWVYRVFEARTGTPVREFTLPGTTAPERTCPKTALAPGGALYRQQVESADLRARIGPLYRNAR
ncbi:hypothetical protein ABZ929_00930 [Streptomyces physcomitrii]|uniref:hypothetical protein n=1 Tax=Streptomyces physcomitrii TaxID=2724184 RepID=UPI0033C07739